jgi:hypothetical protein
LGLDEELNELNVSFYQPEQASDVLSEMESGQSDIEVPGLVLVDWYLNQEDDGYDFKGLTFEARLREVFGSIPVYGFSGEEASFGGQLSEERFDREFPIDKLTAPDVGEQIAEDIKDYRRIKKAVGGSEADIIDLLDASDSAKREQVKSTLPGEFENGIPTEEDSGGSAGLQFARWVRNRFLRVPGPTWGPMFTATKLGIDVDTFNEEYREKFESDRYQGVFSFSAEPRWWQRDIIDNIVSLNDDSNIAIGETWRSVPQILNVDSEDRPECEVCGDDYPETVAQTETSPTGTYPVHYGCSRIKKQREGAFNERRIIPSGRDS